MHVKARFTCTQITDQQTSPGYGNPPTIYTQREVRFTPVSSNDPNDPNRAFWEATPSGEMKMHLTPKGGAYDAFKPGVTYELDIRPVEG